MDILIPVLTLSILGFLFGIGLSWALKIFSIKTDPMVDRVLSVLPGANCGACGYAGCFALAEALAGHRGDITLCAPGGHEVHEKLAQMLGVQLKEKTRFTAAVFCNGGTRAVDKYTYIGPAVCAQAKMLSFGQKLCSFACLGFGDCVRACPFNAMSMGKDNIPIINKERCTSCGKCIKVCPKDLIKLIPYSARVYVKCNSKDKGAVAMKACPAGCIACRKCELTSKTGAFKVENNLARVDFSKLTDEDGKNCSNVCPTKVIVWRD